MKSTPTTPQVLGPYAETSAAGKRRWRVIVIELDGRRRASVYDTLAAGKTAVATARGAVTGRPTNLGELVDLFIATKRKADAWAARTYDRARLDLGGFATPDSTPLSQCDDDFVRAWLLGIEHLALASRRSRYAAVHGLLAWACKRRYIDENPCDRIETDELPWRSKRGRAAVNRGKVQLRGRDEAQKYLDAALAWPLIDDRLAAALPLLTGMRSGEFRHLRVGDVDFAGGCMWVRDDGRHADGWAPKTASSSRAVQIPAVLELLLRRLVVGRSPEAYLLGNRRIEGEPMKEDRIWRLVGYTCERAGVRKVCPHGLRGTYATLMAELGNQSLPQIATLLGHADSGSTASRHYVGTTEKKPQLRLVAI